MESELFYAVVLGCCIGASFAIGVFMIKQSVGQRSLSTFDIPLTEKQSASLQTIVEEVERDLTSYGLPESTLDDVEVILTRVVFTVEGTTEKVESIQAAYQKQA